MPPDSPSHSRDEIVARLRTLLPELRQEFGVRTLSVFGSRARETADRGSDLDLLIEFEQTPGFFRFVELEDRLGHDLGLRVDLVMKTALRPHIGRRVLAEAIAV